MSSEASDKVMALLSELAVLREQDKQSDSSSEAERETQKLRQQRQQEIAQEIKTLSEQTKNSG